MSAYGPPGHRAATQHLGRFQSEADINRQARLAGSVEKDPSRHFSRIMCRDAAGNHPLALRRRCATRTKWIVAVVASEALIKTRR